jgi:TonB family protein
VRQSIHRTFPAPSNPTPEEVDMQPPIDRTKRRLPPALSLAIHGVLLASVVVAGTVHFGTHKIRPVQPETIARIEVSGGSHAIKIKLPPMPTASHTREPAKTPNATKKTILPVEQPPLKWSGGGSPAAPHKGDGSGQALRGNGSDADDVRPAFPVFSPRPPVTDRSLLPNSEQKIVVDVNVDALGQVVSEKLMNGMGNKLDQIVLDIVKTWRFQPATVNGKPVPTQAELIFPFNPSYPITDS